MKPINFIFALITVTYVSIGTALAGDPNPSLTKDNLPSNLWERLTYGVELATILPRPSDSGASSVMLDIYIKNTSDKQLRLNPNEGDLGIKILLMDDSKVETPLHNYANRTVFLLNFAPILMDPGATVLVKITLNLDEYALLTKNLVGFSFSLYNITDKQRYALKSSFKKMIETQTVSTDGK